MSRNIEDISGQIFGSLKAAEYLGTRKCGKTTKSYWKCKCSCGVFIEVNIGDLKRKDGKAIISCGCRRRRKWEPVFEGSICKIPLNKNQYAIIDKEDYDKVKDFGWSTNNSGYIRSSTNKKGHINLARLIMNTPEELEVDHMNHNKLDNRKVNLRNVTAKINMGNRKPFKWSNGTLYIPKGFLANQ